MTLSKRTRLVDVALIATILIWAVNFSVVKATLNHLHPFAFNSIRLIGASAIFLLLTRIVPSPKIRTEDWPRIVVLALVGHLGYQLFFILGLRETTASNSAILLSLTPVFVAVFGTLLGIERPGALAWTGIGVSVLGVYLVIHDTVATGGSRLGDGLALGAACCWALYTVLGHPIVERYGSFKTNAYTMALGTLGFLPFGLPALVDVEPSTVPAAAWGGTVFSLVFALVAAYCFWYYAVSRIGPTSTAIYSNLMPALALVTAWLTLGEPIGAYQIVGAAVILLGIYLVRRPRT